MKGARTKTTPSPTCFGSPEVAMSAHADTHSRHTIPSHRHVYTPQDRIHSLKHTTKGHTAAFQHSRYHRTHATGYGNAYRRIFSTKDTTAP